MENFVPCSGLASQQGRRASMEDTHVCIDDVSKVFPDVEMFKSEKYSYYAVFDGHGGVEVAQMAEALLHKHIFLDPSFEKKDIETAIKNGFEKTDKEILEKAKEENWHSGTTVVITIVHQKTLYLANLGDSEAVLAKRNPDGTLDPVLMSFKHKPGDNNEKERIKKAGGHVVFGRVMGSLAVARALGDKDFKFPYNKADADFVSADPYVTKIDLTNEDEFMIISCDGLWDRLSYKQAVDFINDQRLAGKEPTEASELLVKDSIDRGTMDNVTAIVVYMAPSAQNAQVSKPPSTNQTEEEEEDAMDIYEYLKKEAEKNKEKEIVEKLKDFDIPSDEPVQEEFSCVLGNAVSSGTMAITQSYIYYCSTTLFGKKQMERIALSQIVTLEKRNSLLTQNPAVKIVTDSKKYMFFWKNTQTRDKAYRSIVDRFGSLPSAPKPSLKEEETIEEEETKEASQSTTETKQSPSESGVVSFSRFDN